LLAVSLAGAGLASALAQEPAPPQIPEVEIAGVGKLQMLPDMADGDWVFFAKLTPQNLGALKLVVALLYQPDSGDHYQLRLGAKEAQFYLVTKGKSQPLGSVGVPGELLKPDQPTDLSVRRDGWNLSLLIGGRLVCTAQDLTFSSGGVGFTVTGAALADPLLQFIGDMGFEDDFMRGTEERSLWQPVSGSWQEESLRIDPQASTMQETHSANAFSYLGRAAQGRALTVAGYWFWSDYRVQASVRPLGGGAAGLVALYRDPDNYLALRWTPRASSAGDGNRLQIIQRVGGEERVLAETPGGFRPEQWYQLALAVSGPWVKAYLDGELVLNARNETFRQGKCGLLVEGNAGVNFDDVMLVPWGYFADDFLDGGRWDAVAGKWQRSAGRYTAAGSGMLLGPLCDWPRFAFSADAHVDKGSAGLIVGYRDAKNYALLRYSVTSDGARLELVNVSDGQEKVLASAPAERSSALAVRLGVEVDRNVLAGEVGDTRLVRAPLPALPTGRLGLYTSSGGWFSFVESQRVEPPPVAHVTKEFRDDKEHWEMAAWATRRSPWLIPPGLQVERDGNLVLRDFSSPSEFGNHVWWTKGDYFGDKVVSFKIPSWGRVSGTARVTLDAHPGAGGEVVGGYTLAVGAKAGTKVLYLALGAADRALAETTVTVEEDECAIEFAHLGSFLQVRVNDNLVLQTAVSG